jgi:hypothetical protein
MSDTPILDVAVVFERRQQPTQWEDWGFRLLDVMPDDGRHGTEPRILRDDGRVRHTLYPGFRVGLHRDEGQGYYLNLTSGAPAWFVMFRIDEADPSCLRPQVVTVSYDEAARMLDAQERVENVPLTSDVRAWVQAFADQHYRPEPRKRARPASFRRPDER